MDELTFEIVFIAITFFFGVIVGYIMRSNKEDKEDKPFIEFVDR